MKLKKIKIIVSIIGPAIAGPTGPFATRLYNIYIYICIYLRCFTGTALHIRDAVPVSAAVATRSRGDCRSMEDRRRKSVINFLLIKCLILTTSVSPILVDF